MIDSSGSPTTRPPMASDVTATACRIMGLNFSDFFIPGGYGEVVGIRKV
jgi:hypothetical protein